MVREHKTKSPLPVYAAQACLLALFCYSLYPLHGYFPELSRSHEWALPYTPAQAAARVVIVLALTAVFFGGCRLLPQRFAAGVDGLLARLGSAGPGLTVGLLCALVLALSVLLCFAVLGGVPHVQDSIAQLFQAKIFASGSLTAPLPLHKDFFDYMNVINERRWYSQYPPGHALLLLPGVLAGVPWLVNPLLGALSVALLFAVARRMYPGGGGVALLAAALWALSPFLWFMSASFMNHTSTMLVLLAALYAHVRSRQEANGRWAFLCGCALGFACNIRPLTAFAVGAVLLADMAISGRGGSLRFRKPLMLCCGALLFLVPLFSYNYATNGSPFTFGYQVRHGAMGFLGSAQFGFPHTLAGGFVNTNNNLVALNTYLFEWPVPALLLPVLLFLLPGRSRSDRLLGACALAPVVAYFFYYFQDLCFGPRFLFCTGPALCLLTARCLCLLPGIVSKHVGTPRAAAASLCVLLAGCYLYSAAVAVPGLIGKYGADYWYVGTGFLEIVRRKHITNAIIFMDVALPRESVQPNIMAYGEGFLHNSPGLDTDIIYAMDLGWKNLDLMDQYPDRSYYLLTYRPVPWTFAKTTPYIVPLPRAELALVSTGLRFDVSRRHPAEQH